MTRHDVDNPDPLCWGDDPCVCEQLIEARKQTIRDCIEVVHKYAEERLVKTKHYNLSDDITAALRVAANRLRAIQAKP
jgi:hypothetical protein